jgi:hypothetical protein
LRAFLQYLRMSSHTTHPAPALKDPVLIVKGALANLQLKGKQALLTSLLLAAARKTPPTEPESAVLQAVYGGAGVDNSNKSSLRDLALQVNKRLKKLPVDSLTVCCETSGHGASKIWRLRIEPLAAIPSAESASLKHGKVSNGVAKPQFKWSGPGVQPRTRHVWVPVHGEDTEFTFRTESESWTPPPGFTGYAKHRENCWKEYQTRCPDKPDSRVWHVAEFTQKNDRDGRTNRSIELTIAPIFFKDVVATTWQLKKEIALDDGTKTNIHDWIATATPSKLGCRHFVPAGNPLLVQVNIITQDGKLIVRKHKDENGSLTRHEAAIFGFVNSLQDVYRDALHIPAPSETVFRKSCQLLGLPVHPARIRWLGVGFGQEEGKVSLLGEVVVGLTAEEIKQRNRAPEILDAIAITPAAIHKFCWENRPRGHFETLLALSLKRRCPKVKIITTVAK